MHLYHWPWTCETLLKKTRFPVHVADVPSRNQVAFEEEVVVVVVVVVVAVVVVIVVPVALTS